MVEISCHDEGAALFSCGTPSYQSLGEANTDMTTFFKYKPAQPKISITAKTDQKVVEWSTTSEEFCPSPTSILTRSSDTISA